VDKDSFLKKIDNMISSIFSSSLEEEPAKKPKSKNVPQTIEEYTVLTGKRFRMTKCQKELGLSRHAAFREFITTDWRK